MVEELDPGRKRPPARRPGPVGGGLLDLPLGSGQRPARAKPPSPPPAPQARYARRRRPVRPWLLILLLVAVAAGAFRFWPRGEPARIEPSVAALEFGARRIAAAGEPLELRLANGGERPLRVRRLELSGAAAELFSVAAEACLGRRVGAGEDCLVAIDYRPRESGAHQAVLRVEARAANAPLELPLSGTGVTPRVRLDRDRLRFDPLPVGGRSVGLAVKLESVGDAPVRVGELSLEGGSASEFRLEADRCSSRELEPGRGCSLRVAFAPAGEGERRAELRLPSDAVEGAVAVRLAGSGLPAPQVALAPSRLVFGEQLVEVPSAPLTLTLANRGRDRLGLGRVRIARNAGGFALAEDGCSSRTLAAGAACRMLVTFTPQSEGEASRRLEVPQAGGTGLAWRADLVGTGVAPRLAWSARRLEWPETRVAAEAEPRTLTLGNAGTGTLRLEPAKLTGPDADAFSVSEDGCAGLAIEPGSECRLTVGFRPDHLDRHQASLEVAGVGLRGDRSASLAGVGVAGRLQLESTRLEFGSVRVTEAGRRDLLIANTGNADLTLRGFAASGGAGADYRLAGDCRVGAALEPGGTCRLEVRFAPVRAGGRLATLEIVHDGLAGPGTVALSGAGLPPPAGELRLDRRVLAFGELRVGERSGILSITLSNAGPGPVTLRGFELRGAHAGDFRMVPGSCEGIPFLAPGGRCGVGFRFLPTAAGGRSATLVIRHNAPGGQLTLRLEGAGVPTAG